MADDQPFESVKFTGTIKSFKVSGDAGEDVLQLVIETANSERRTEDLTIIGRMKHLGTVEVNIGARFARPPLFGDDAMEEKRPRCATCFSDGTEDLDFGPDPLPTCPTCGRMVPEGASFAACAACNGESGVECGVCNDRRFFRVRCLELMAIDAAPDEWTIKVEPRAGETVFECGYPLPCARHPQQPLADIDPADADHVSFDELALPAPAAEKPKRKPAAKRAAKKGATK